MRTATDCPHRLKHIGIGTLASTLGIGIAVGFASYLGIFALNPARFGYNNENEAVATLLFITIWTGGLLMVGWSRTRECRKSPLRKELEELIAPLGYKRELGLIKYAETDGRRIVRDRLGFWEWWVLIPAVVITIVLIVENGPAYVYIPLAFVATSPLSYFKVRHALKWRAQDKKILQAPNLWAARMMMARAVRLVKR